MEADRLKRLTRACTDHDCIWGHPGGMGTNGGCQHRKERDPAAILVMLERARHVVKVLEQQHRSYGNKVE